jgi:prevent-host-death family protein
MAISLTVTATEANRNFSRILREVALGKRVKITSHGREIAVVAPSESDVEIDRRARAYAELKKHMSRVTPVTVGPWTRDDLNERD